MQFFAAAALDCTDDVFRTDFKAGVKAAIGGDGFGVWKPPRCDDMCKPGNGSNLPDLWGTRQDTQHFGSGQGAI